MGDALAVYAALYREMEAGAWDYRPSDAVWDRLDNLWRGLTAAERAAAHDLLTDPRDRAESSPVSREGTRHMTLDEAIAYLKRHAPQKGVAPNDVAALGKITRKVAAALGEGLYLPAFTADRYHEIIWCFYFYPEGGDGWPRTFQVPVWPCLSCRALVDAPWHDDGGKRRYEPELNTMPAGFDPELYDRWAGEMEAELLADEHDTGFGR